MKRKNIIYILILSLTLVVLIAGSAFFYLKYQTHSHKPDKITRLETQSNEFITIGAALPLTGDIASYGLNSKNGLDIALQNINSDPTKKHKLKINYQDSKGITKEAINIMQHFASMEKYPVVIGEAASSVSLAMIPIANQYNVVQISPVSSSPELSIDDFFYRVCPSDSFQAVISAKWMIEENIKNVGVLYVNNSWGNSLKEEFVKQFQSMGGKSQITEGIKEGDRDFKTAITKLIKSNIDAIYCPTYGKEGGLILKQLKEQGNKLPVYGADVWSSPELIDTAKNSAEGVKLVKPDKFNNDVYASFQKRYIETYGKEPDVYAAYAYDIAMILSLAIESGNRSGEQIKHYLNTMPIYYGVTGETKFDLNGDSNTKPFIKLIITRGGYEIVK